MGPELALVLVLDGGAEVRGGRVVLGVGMLLRTGLHSGLVFGGVAGVEVGLG